MLALFIHDKAREFHARLFDEMALLGVAKYEGETTLYDPIAGEEEVALLKQQAADCPWQYCPYYPPTSLERRGEGLLKPWAEALRRHVHSDAHGSEPEWSNSDASKWCTSGGFMEVMKVFSTKLSGDHRSSKRKENQDHRRNIHAFVGADDIAFGPLVAMLRRCDMFEAASNTHVSRTCARSVVAVRNKWANNARQEFTDAETSQLLDQLRTFLQEEPNVAPLPEAREALRIMEAVRNCMFSEMELLFPNAAEQQDQQDVATTPVSVSDSCDESSSTDSARAVQTCQTQQKPEAKMAEMHQKHAREEATAYLVAKAELVARGGSGGGSTAGAILNSTATSSIADGGQ
jgi:hypothetical protein